MAKHLSVRLPWHDRGWDGHVCDRPTANVFCTGEYGLKAHGIREGKKDAEEEACGRSHVPLCAPTTIALPAYRRSRHSAEPHRCGTSIIRSRS